MTVTLIVFFAILFLAGGLNHIFNPKFYKYFIPGGLPKLTVNYVSGILEILLGAGVAFVETRYWSAAGILILMILFLPLHVIDLFRERPAIGSRLLAIIRLPVQFLLIWGAWWLMQQYKS
ncbi:MAG: hypothetical protein WDO14_22135 [Bacteroidota bacterium]